MPATLLQILGLLVGVAVPLASFATGLRSTDPLWLWKRPRLLARSLLAVLVLVPVIDTLLVEVISPGNVYVRAGIVVSVLAVGVGPPQLLQRTRGSKNCTRYEIGLDVALMALAVVYLPIAVAVHGAIFHHEVSLRWTEVAQVVALQAILPFFAGIAVARWLPKVAVPLERHAPKVVGAIMAVVALLALVLAWRSLLALGVRAWLTCLLIAAIAIAIGHVAGGPDRESRAVLAGFSALRWPALALLITSTVPGDHGARLIPVVLAYVISSGALIALYRAATRERADALP